MRLHLTLVLHFVVQSDSILDLYPNSMTLGHKFVSTVTDIPHHVLVVYGSLYCSGSLIRSRIVLTTASCLAGEDQKNIFVKVGASSITGLGQVIRVLEVKIHEYFRYYSEIDNDIAMLFLKDNVAFSNRVKKVIMTDPETQIVPGTLIEVSGWGSQPFGVQTLGSWGPSAKIIYKEIAKRLIDSTRDQKAGLFFAQRISIAIQRGNAASLLGTLPVDIDGEEYFDT